MRRELNFSVPKVKSPQRKETCQPTRQHKIKQRNERGQEGGTQSKRTSAVRRGGRVLGRGEPGGGGLGKEPGERERKAL